MSDFRYSAFEVDAFTACELWLQLAPVRGNQFIARVQALYPCVTFRDVLASLWRWHAKGLAVRTRDGWVYNKGYARPHADFLRERATRD